MIINVSDYGILPGTECGAELERIINNIPRDDAEKVLKFQEGDYYIDARNLTKRKLFVTNTAGDNEYSAEETPHSVPVALYFDGFKNLTVEGCGARFIISGKTTNCVVSNCENFVLRDIVIDTDKPDFHELKVVGKGGFYADFELSEYDDYEFRNGTVIFKGNGFETDIKHKSKSAWWPNKVSGENREENVRSKHPLMLSLKLKKISENTVRSYCLDANRFNIGDIFYIFDNRRQFAGIFVDNSKDVTLQGIAQHFNYSLAVVCQCSENITLEKLSLTPQNGYFVTSVADFVQCCMCRGYFNVTDCVFDGAGDDTINCHGFHFKVTDVSENKVQVKFMHPQSHGYNPFRKGDKIAFIDKATLLEKGQSEVASSRLLDEYTIELLLNGEKPSVNMMVENISACPDLYFARNEVHRIVTRAMLITTRGKVLVEDNHFYGNGMSGILFSDDASSWYESGMCTDVTVKNNVFDWCGDHGIMIKPENSSHGGAIHKNIRISENTFNKCGKVCFYAKSSSDLQFINNKISSAPAVFKTVNCENVTVE